jgi:hypothetical protein
MRTLAVLIAFLISGACAASSYMVGDDLEKALAAFSSAAGLAPISGEVDELRIWRRDYMSGQVLGYAIARNRALRCLTTSRYADGIVTINRARCRRMRARLDDLEGLGAMAMLNGKQWDCPVFDGESVYVEGTRAGTRFVLRVGNPGFCETADSKAVARILRQLE